MSIYLIQQLANALLTVPRAVGNLAGNTTLLQLENWKKSKGNPQLTGRVLTTMRLIHERTDEDHEWLAHSFPTQDLPKRYK